MELYARIWSRSETEAITSIHRLFQHNPLTVVSFVYFATLECEGWFEGCPTPEYERALLSSDFVLADGIALRLLHFKMGNLSIPGWKILFQYPKYSKLAVPNLNGTDFVPKLLHALRDGLSGERIAHGTNNTPRLVMYGSKPTTIPKAQAYAEKEFGLKTLCAHGYAPFPMELLDEPGPIIFLVGLGAPRQEIWIAKHRELLAARGNILVLGVGGLFEFWAGDEVRAPEFIRKIGLEWLWRVITKPKKNFKKALTSLRFFLRLLGNGSI